jgi:hypothetical protein
VPLPPEIQPPPKGTLLTRMSDWDTADREEAQLDPDTQAVLDKLEGDNSLADLVETLARDLGLEDYELAMLTGASTRFVLQTDRNDDVPCVERLGDLAATAALLIRDGGISPSRVVGWLRSRNRDLAWSRPLDALRYRGFLPVYSAAEAACEVMAARELDLSSERSE